jgi:hypothetical protein
MASINLITHPSSLSEIYQRVMVKVFFIINKECMVTSYAETPYQYIFLIHLANNNYYACLIFQKSQ